MAPSASRSAQAPFKKSHDEVWAVHFAELKAWCGTHERLPRRSAPIGPERSLADFVSNQRRLAGQGQLKEERRRMLSAIPGALKTSTYAEARQGSWEARVAELQAWHSDHGRLPRQKGKDQELVLARFIKRQREEKASGKLSDQRREKLELIPGVFAPAQKAMPEWSHQH